MLHLKQLATFAKQVSEMAKDPFIFKLPLTVNKSDM